MKTPEAIQILDEMRMLQPLDSKERRALACAIEILKRAEDCTRERKEKANGPAHD